MKIPRSILGYTTGHIVIDLYSPVIPALIPLLVLYPGIGYFLAGLLVSVFSGDFVTFPAGCRVALGPFRLVSTDLDLHPGKCRLYRPLWCGAELLSPSLLCRRRGPFACPVSSLRPDAGTW